MSTLEVPGANIYHETYGDGPVLLCISGADGSCEIWRFFAESLKDHFKVVLWDRKDFVTDAHRTLSSDISSQAAASHAASSPTVKITTSASSATPTMPRRSSRSTHQINRPRLLATAPAPSSRSNCSPATPTKSRRSSATSRQLPAS